MYKLLIFLLKRTFLDVVEKNQKPVFLKFESSCRFCILNGAQSFKFFGFIYTTLIGWKREDQALISISTILKFSALSMKNLLCLWNVVYMKCTIYLWYCYLWNVFLWNVPTTKITNIEINLFTTSIKSN